MREEAVMLAIVVREVRQIECEIQSGPKLLEVAGQACVDGIARHIYDTSVRKHRVKETEVIRILRHLVDHALRGGGNAVE